MNENIKTMCNALDVYMHKPWRFTCARDCNNSFHNVIGHENGAIHVPEIQDWIEQTYFNIINKKNDE